MPRIAYAASMNGAAAGQATVGDTRIHGTTKRHVGKVFQEVERAALTPLSGRRFPSFQEAQRTVARDGHIEVAKAHYSVPPEYLGCKVWARWDARMVHTTNHRWEQIALHVRYGRGRFDTLGQHVHKRKTGGLKGGAAYLLDKIHAFRLNTLRNLLSRRNAPEAAAVSSTSTPSSGRWTITPRPFSGRSVAKAVARPWAKVN